MGVAQLTDQDLASRLDKLEPAVNDIQRRVVQLEKSDAVAEVHRHNVEKRLTSIEEILNRLVWLIMGVLITGIGAFVLRGGLNLGP